MSRVKEVWIAEYRQFTTSQPVYIGVYKGDKNDDSLHSARQEAMDGCLKDYTEGPGLNLTYTLPPWTQHTPNYWSWSFGALGWYSVRYIG